MTEFEASGGEIIPAEAEVVEGALEVMERAQIDTQIKTAKAYPRDLTAFQKRAKSLATIDRETAESCIYSRPVGKDERGKPIFAKGESIRLAEIVAACYGNLRVQGMIVEMTPKYVKALGIAHDLESNYAQKAEVVESTLTKRGFPVSERQRIVIAKAAQSKAIRDAIFRVVPKGLCKSIVAEANNVIFGKNRPLAERRAVVDAWVKKLPIDPIRVWSAMGVKSLEELGDDELQLLTGIRTALKDGETTIDEAFPPVNPEPSDEPKTGVQGLKDKLGSKKQDPKKADSGQEQSKPAGFGFAEPTPDEIPFGND